MEEGSLVDKWYAVGPEDRRSNLTVGVVCGQHAREVISSEICYHLITLLYGKRYHETLSPLLDDLHEKGVRFWVLPVVNVWGRQEIESDPERGCLRTNRFGVDLNRNFPCPDLELGAQEEGSVDWPGPSPFSELESMATDQFLQLAEPEILLNVHSGIERVLLPYDCCPLDQPSLFSPIIRLVQRAKGLVAKYTRDKGFTHVNPRGWDTGQSAHLLYTAHGTLMDYAMTMRSVQMALTLEVYQEHGLSTEEELTEEANLSPHQCARWFNPPSGKVYEEVVESWLLFILQLTRLADEAFVVE